MSRSSPSQFSSPLPQGGSTPSLRESQPFRVKEFVDFEVKTNPGANPNSLRSSQQRKF
jgi:hypothetical protein